DIYTVGGRHILRIFAGYDVHTSLAAAFSSALATQGLPGIARACGEVFGDRRSRVGVVQAAPLRSILHHPDPWPFPTRGREKRFLLKMLSVEWRSVNLQGMRREEKRRCFSTSGCSAEACGLTVPIAGKAMHGMA
ncbi:hypothetical protein, partial [Methylobacterium sp. GC_Met_2]|uniref:hypothetical protein n=1 Tax=Methylobacterium sp. GC_Met_2 TaxID=2937376 RepID=UPI00226B22B2